MNAKISDSVYMHGYMNLISRQAATDNVEKIEHIATLPDGDPVIKLSAVKNVLSALPSAHPDIVYCRDCVFGYCEVWLTGCGDATGDWYCGRTNLWVLPYDFCSNAERKSNR